jgi:threonyl-tRNA synthetase
MSVKSSSKNYVLDTKRHSFAHLMAAAVLEMFPETIFGVGPVIENGCYYDFILPRTLIPEDLTLIEEKVKELMERDLVFKTQEMSLVEAIGFFMDRGQKLKVELLHDIKTRGTTKLDETESELFEAGETPKITIYRLVDEQTGEVVFEDLCKGPHVPSIKDLNGQNPGLDSPIIKNGRGLPIGFKLDKFSGAYWRGDQKRDIQMQRIYALVFDNDEILGNYLFQRTEAKKRDHRILGEQMELFTFSDIVGKGLPLWLEKGATIRRILERFIVEEEIRRGYRHVITPDIAKLDLYQKSGHYPYYKDSMYAPIQIDNEEFMLRPMTCPHHFQIYSQKPRSYKELPMRIAEIAKLYRYEDSGALSGLTRVRSFCLADSHIVCSPEQAENEVQSALDLIEYCAEVFGLEKGKDFQYRLSLGDRSEDGKYYKDDGAWEEAENILRLVLKDREAPFFEATGEAAFYGPKIDIQMKNISGKEETAFTVQYDFVMPKRFELSYFDENQEKHECIVIHRSSIGALERVFAFLVEFYGGRFPFWLAPEQIRILTVNDKVFDYVAQIKEILNDTVLMQPLKFNEIRVNTDDRAESLGKKIREAELDKIPVIMIVGPKDMENNEVSLRTQEGEKKVKLDELQGVIQSLK